MMKKFMGIAAHVVATDTERVPGPLFAINWFQTRSLPLYNLYNYLAGPSLFRVGGRVFFKGTVKETLQGANTLGRVLLVVNYPNGHSFLQLLAGRFFQSISLLRIMAVRSFEFVFHRRLDGAEHLSERVQSFDRSDAWAIQIASGPDGEELPVRGLRDAAREADIELHFASQITATLRTRKANTPPREVPYTATRLLIFAGQEEALRRHLLSQAHQAAMGPLGLASTSLVERML